MAEGGRTRPLMGRGWTAGIAAVQSFIVAKQRTVPRPIAANTLRQVTSLGNRIHYPKEVNAMSLDHWQRPTIANMLNGHIPIGELTCKVCLRRGSLYRFP